MQRVIAETTERVDVPRTRRVRTCLSLSRKAIKSPESPRANLVRFLPSYEHCYSGAETREGSRNAAAVMSSPTSSPFADVIQSLAGLHQEHHQALLDMREDQEPFLRPRPKPAGGPRAVPELDGPGTLGWGDSTSPSPAHPHAVAEDGAAGRPGGVSRPV